MFFSKGSAAASALIFGSAYGHMIMNTPTPYGFADLQTSPLNGENYLFPCQSGSRTDAFDATGVNNPVTAGGAQTVKFTGSAVHGGGSCQFSVTYDYPPPADPSKWKVIHTIIGGCPASTTGNLVTSGSDADGRPTASQCSGGSTTDCLRQFDIPIPKEIKNGNATFAWTWFNKIGNREMYMNCAPISISGGSDDDTYVNSLPDMFLANIPGQCTTVEGVLNIPNPGDSVEVLQTPDSSASGSCSAGGSVSGGASSASAAPVASSSPAAAASSAVASAPGVFAPGAATSAAAYSSAAVAPESSAVATPTLATVVQSSAAAGTGVAAPSGAAGSAKVACSNEGGVVCMGTDYFGLCDHGFAVKMAVSAGTKCENGAISRRSMPRKHLHARIHGHS